MSRFLVAAILTLPLSTPITVANAEQSLWGSISLASLSKMSCDYLGVYCPSVPPPCYQNLTNYYRFDLSSDSVTRVDLRGPRGQIKNSITCLHPPPRPRQARLLRLRLLTPYSGGIVLTKSTTMDPYSER